MAERKRTARGPKVQVRPGMKFNRLKVMCKNIDHISPNGTHHPMFLCLCDCGRTLNVSPEQLQNGNTKSCGCYKGDKIGSFNRTHGMSNTTEASIVHNIRQRCNNKNCTQYKDYGGRGISYCKTFSKLESFVSIVGERPSKKHTIDRIDNDSGYWCGVCEECVAHNRPCNVRWATTLEQQNNTRRTRLLTYNGDSMSVAQWSRKLGIPAHQILARLRRGRTTDEALSFKRYQRTGSTKNRH